MSGTADPLALSPSEGEPRVESVAFTNVPSFVLHGGLAVKLASRTIRADVAFGGAFYAIVDSEAVGLPIDAAHLPELRRVGMEIKHAIEAAQRIVHPLEAGLSGIYGTIFTGPPSDEGADLRNVTIFADAEVDRSPCGIGIVENDAYRTWLTAPSNCSRNGSILIPETENTVEGRSGSRIGCPAASVGSRTGTHD